MEKTLVIMAAGIGSRFGKGIKQLEPVGPNKEIIMDYSIYDAKRAGFNKVIFIIRKDLEKDFKEIIGNKVEKFIDVDYAFQEIDDLPNGFAFKGKRKKPWGTGQAVLSIKNLIKGPFVVINADDFYGNQVFDIMSAYLDEGVKEENNKYFCCMGSFLLNNTLSENGGVSRGVCTVDSKDFLSSVTETYEIKKVENKLIGKDESSNEIELKEDTVVSMNVWGLPKEFIKELEEGFKTFLENIKEDDLKTEYLLPKVIDDCIQSEKADVKVLRSKDRWFGVTYQEDKEEVVSSIRELIKKGVYPEKIYE